MRAKIMTVLFLVTSIAGFSQQKNYGIKKIGQWMFEKFPLHYSVKPAKTVTYRNKISGKLEEYEEFNQFGQTDGLKLTMYSDGIYPYSAIYVYKGETVYSVTFFPKSKIAQYITMYNEKGQKDGYVINRTLKETGGYKEDVEKYINGVLVELNGVKEEPFSTVYKDSLLDGRFKFRKGLFVFEGVAEKGKLKTIKQSMDGRFSCEMTFLNDSILMKEPSEFKAGYDIVKFPIFSNPTITNSRTMCLKFGNYNGFPYYVLPDDFKIWDLREIALRIYSDSLSTIDNYKDSLLDGAFQYRQYKISRNYSNDEWKDVYGVAEKGKLIELSIFNVGYDNLGKRLVTLSKYELKGDELYLYDLDIQTGEEKSLIKKIKISNPVLLTNSETIGGTIAFYENSWDNFNNTLKIPAKREGTLKNNQSGYFFFSPFTFDVSNYLSEVIKN